MYSFTTPNGTLHAKNQYDSNNRVIQQTQHDGGVYALGYTLGSNGSVTARNITDPCGYMFAMNMKLEWLSGSDTLSVGKPKQQQNTYNRDSTTNLITPIVDALGPTTAYAYDSLANVTSLTRLAGTSQAVTTSFTYGVFSPMASMTDPLGHTWTLGAVTILIPV